jgi:flagellar motility protein MotE (MotC chaperone)
MSGSMGGTPTNPSGGGGFVQGVNPFSGLTNTDLRPRRRRRRPVPLLDTSWLLTRRMRRKGPTIMRKNVAALVDTLNKSVQEIAASGAENTPDLLQKSMTEFQATLLQTLEPVLPTELEQPLGKGLNHIALFANTLRDCGRAVNAIKTGRPPWLVGNDESWDDDKLSEAAKAGLDRFMDVGWLTLRTLANENVALPDDEDDLERAEQAGELAKVEAWNGEEYLVKTALPEAYRGFLTDPVDLVADYATIAREFANDAIDIAEPLAKVGLLPDDLTEAFPELFEQPQGPGAYANDDVATGLGKAAGDEDFGAGGDPDGAPDPTDTDMSDDAVENPIEMMVRLAGVIVVIGGSIMQAAQGAANDATAEPPMEAPPAPDPTARRPAFAKQEAIEDIPLEKILRGEVTVSDSVADALEERETLRAQLAKVTANEAATQETLRKLQETVERLSSLPAAPKGHVFAVSKRDDLSLPGQPDQQAEAERVAELAKSNPDAAAREMLKMAHRAGGHPLIAPG